ncbi:protein kinase [Sinorhizobium medicae]|uniref:serine/threonine-protein kinase n=1 Tax=Sinorhizobium medicae TaxID=110321 RepID=UPI00119BEB4C|nr:serine/threonine-protein kinase [Sinorhizobium medicae]MDX1004586.1 protein kinase [Sinorhizobium medicae]MDX1066024.1 protein kinase [Sinorhizobium medicae]MQU79346.1 protein kinase [Sinorhizobium medicae]TWA32902.1 serine/threonine protein kinase [Sinorhizobium medicae]
MTNLQSTLVVGEEISHGHFGRVHIGHDGIRDPLAVKVLFAIEGETPHQWSARKTGLLQEGASLERARHRNIVAVHYLCASATDDAIHLVMEYCSGGSFDALYKEGPIRPDLVLKAAREICHGLAALHDRGMLHRDIKPGNILLDANGVAKIGDFGFVTDEIIEGYAIGGGYRDHLAPEFYSDRISSVRTDLWALGVTLYRLLHGHPWYASGPAPRSVVQNGGYADTLEWLPHIGKKWRRVIRNLLKDAPNDRPTDARALNRLLADVEPLDWHCEISEDRTQWSRVVKSREIVVTLEKHNGRSFSWNVVSYPVTTGKSKTLYASGKMGYRQAERELREYFG